MKKPLFIFILMFLIISLLLLSSCNIAENDGLTTPEPLLKDAYSMKINAVYGNQVEPMSSSLCYQGVEVVAYADKSIKGAVFAGWYNSEDQLLSIKYRYTFYMPEHSYTIYALFEDEMAFTEKDMMLKMLELPECSDVKRTEFINISSFFVINQSYIVIDNLTAWECMIFEGLPFETAFAFQRYHGTSRHPDNNSEIFPINQSNVTLNLFAPPECFQGDWNDVTAENANYVVLFSKNISAIDHKIKCADALLTKTSICADFVAEYQDDEGSLYRMYHTPKTDEADTLLNEFFGEYCHTKTLLLQYPTVIKQLSYTDLDFIIAIKDINPEADPMAWRTGTGYVTYQLDPKHTVSPEEYTVLLIFKNK